MASSASEDYPSTDAGDLGTHPDDVVTSMNAERAVVFRRSSRQTHEVELGQLRSRTAF